MQATSRQLTTNRQTKVKIDQYYVASSNQQDRLLFSHCQKMEFLPAFILLLLTAIFCMILLIGYTYTIAFSEPGLGHFKEGPFHEITQIVLNVVQGVIFMKSLYVNWFFCMCKSLENICVLNHYSFICDMLSQTTYYVILIHVIFTATINNIPVHVLLLSGRLVSKCGI